MVDIVEIKVDCSYGVTQLLVTFRTSDTTEDFSRYRFDVFRSNTEVGGYELHGSDIKNMEYIDTAVNLYDIGIQYYYRVRVTDLIDGTMQMSKVFGSLEKHSPDRYASAIADIEQHYLETVICNDEVYWIKRRPSGTLCSCYDPVRQDSEPDCPYCYGTRFVGGYFPGRKIKVNYQSGLSETEFMDQRGTTDQMTPIQFWSPALPRIEIGDIIAGQNGWRYLVTSVMRTHKNHYILRQIISAQWLPRSDMRYEIALEGSEVT